ncbi:MAG: DUF21 domain-containing protein [Bacteroidetes bacterium]|nr:MAG: DUF21 domain-containing protein [Bacteroidota bacterium]
MTLLILFFLLSIAFSFLCSIWEAVLLSVTPSYIGTLVQSGNTVGETLRDYKKDIDRPLSAILTLNTIAHTVGAIGVGAQAGALFGETTFTLGPVHISMEAIIAALMTLAILILSEIIPKTLGANQWRSLVPFTVYSLRIIVVILSPLVWLSQLITKRLKKNKEASVFSRADFQAMARAGEESGALKASESRTIGNLLKLDQIKVKNIMTPRSVMLSAGVENSVEAYYQEHMPIKNSRIPVFDEEKEQVIGILLKNDLFQSMIEGEEGISIGEIMRPVQFIKSDASLSELEKLFRNNSNHLAMVTDEFGLVMGLVTLEDLMETILGLEIVDEMDDVEDLQKLAREIWVRRHGEKQTD